MPQTKPADQRKRRSKVVLALGAAGLSLSLGSSGSAAGLDGVSSAPVSKQLYEEEISDVSLVTFQVFDSENPGTHGRRARLAMGVGGCAGCGGCACGIGLYYHFTPPVLGDPADPPPRPIRPAHKTNINLAARASHNDLQVLFIYSAAHWLQRSRRLMGKPFALLFSRLNYPRESLRQDT